jgi:hypothetical protein
MADDSLRYWTLDRLRAVRGQTAIGRAADSAGPYPDLNNPAGMTDFMNFLINQVNVLNEIVLQLATEVDRLRGTDGQDA